MPSSSADKLKILDGDLEEDKGMTGLDVSCCMYRSCNMKARVVIHSMNPVLTKEMAAVLQDLSVDWIALSYGNKDFWEKAAEALRYRMYASDYPQK